MQERSIILRDKEIRLNEYDKMIQESEKTVKRVKKYYKKKDCGYDIKIIFCFIIGKRPNKK
jgi:hypothetical protein